MNMPPLNKVCVVGVGAIGGVFAAWLGARLPAGRIALSALARGETLRTLQAEGLCWVDADGTEHRQPLAASGDAAALGVQDLVIVSDRKSTRLNSSHSQQSRMPSSA